MTRAESSLGRGVEGDAAVKPAARPCWRSGAALEPPLAGQPGAGAALLGFPGTRPVLLVKMWHCEAAFRCVFSHWSCTGWSEYLQARIFMLLLVNLEEG